jgi:hypothetical protein
MLGQNLLLLPKYAEFARPLIRALQNFSALGLVPGNTSLPLCTGVSPYTAEGHIIFHAVFAFHVYRIKSVTISIFHDNIRSIIY